MYSLIFSTFWLVVFSCITALTARITAASPIPASGCIVIAILVGAVVTALLINASWKVWTINPPILTIWYTKNSITGSMRFFKQGLSFKLPWEGRVTDDPNSGVIALHRSVTEEDKEEEVYTAFDESVLRFDWKFEWWPNVLDDKKNIRQEACENFIKTTMAIKQTGLRSRLIKYLTHLAKAMTSDSMRDKTEEITVYISDVFGTFGVDSSEELIYGVQVNCPQFMGVLDDAQVVKSRGNVKRAELTGKAAIKMGKVTAAGVPVVDDDVLATMEIITKNVQHIKVDAPAGMNTIIVGNAKI